MKRRAFTLLELLTVIAITAVLLTIITIPLIQSFNIVRAAQGFADAQDRGRTLIDRIVAEVSNAAYVRDNSGIKGNVRIEVPTVVNADAANNTYVRVYLENAKLDIVYPAQGDPTPAPGGGLIDPDTGKVDPTLRAPKGDINLPTATGFKLVRYFIGLKNPLGGTAANPVAGRYVNPYEGVLMSRAAQPDNLFLLFRAEVNLREYDNAQSAWVINRELFDLDNDGTATPAELNTALDDPEFFMLRNEDPLAARVAKARRINAWLRRSRVLTEFSRYDMIMAPYDPRTRQVERYTDPLDGILKPRIISLVQFTPNRVDNEPMSGATAVRSGEETENAGKVGPDSYATDFGNWGSSFVRLRPSGYRDVNGILVSPWVVHEPWISTNPYLIGRERVVGGIVQGTSIYNYTAGNELTAGTELFDITEYLNSRDFDRAQPLPSGAGNLYYYPFSWAIRQAGNRTGNALVNTPNLRNDFIPFVPDPKQGKIVASFNITEVGNGSVLPPAGSDNRPQQACGDPLEPGRDTTLPATAPTTRYTDPMSDPANTASQINQRFNILWNDWASLAPTLEKSLYCKRFVDLRVVPNLDGEPSPLDPRTGYLRACIVPGSEVVIGPDQVDGPNYGQPIRYTRVSTSDNVGPNQYFINYVNQPEPNWGALGFTVPGNIFDPTFYQDSGATQARFVSQVLQPRYRAGYLELNSRPGEPLPVGNISVTYRFQFTEPNDVIEVDYDSRQLMNVLLTIRNFPQSSPTMAPTQQNITLKGQANVRNMLR